MRKSRNSKNNVRNDKAELLYSFMNEYKIKTGEGNPHTHTMMDAPYGSYFIPEGKYSEFIKKYTDAILAGHKLHIVEKHKEFGPILIDFDFVQSKKNKDRYYNDKFIDRVVRLYNKIIKKYLDVPCGKLLAYVCEKKNPVLRGDKYHDGIHIVYPYICTTPSLQMLMRNEFIKYCGKNNLFKNIPHVNTLDDVFDRSVIYSNGWLLYGSTKNKSSIPYYVTHIYAQAEGKIYDTLLPGSETQKEYIKHFINALSCRRFDSPKQETPLSDNIDIKTIDTQISNLKKKLDKDPNNGKCASATLLGETPQLISAASEEILVEAKNLAKILSKKMATSYDTWNRIGLCLFSIDYRLLNDWIEFSKKCPSKYVEGECAKLWKKMRISNYSIATLHYYAKRDNPGLYNSFMEKRVNKFVTDGLDGTHTSIAKLILEKHKFVYKCASIKHNLWYEFKDHRWQVIENAYSLHNKISQDLTLEYSKKQQYFYLKASEKAGRDKEKYIERATDISKIIKKLNDNNFKKSVISECAMLAYDPVFLKNLDENRYLLGFTNGVLDLENNLFRDGCPDDYISLHVDYAFFRHDTEDEIYKEITEFMKKILPDVTIRNYILTLLSTCLSGSISEESFYVFTGSGANGKSKLIELMKYVLGYLYKPMDVTVIVTKKTSSSSATPEIADKKGIRLCSLDEPRASDELNTGFMKIFTGGDEIMGRALFKDPVYFKPQFKPILLCNELPSIRADDDGTWRRIKVVPFLSKFVIKNNATPAQIKLIAEGKNHFWADNTLSEKLPEWRQVFMSMLVDYYQIYKKNGIQHPDIVTKYTDEYRKKCDIYQDFIFDNTEKVDDPKKSTTIATLHQQMRSWYRANYDGKCPGTKDLRKYLTQRLTSDYDKASDSLIGYIMKEEKNDREDNNFLFNN